MDRARSEVIGSGRRATRRDRVRSGLRGAGEAGDVLVIDNGGRSDEACVGDLAVLEAQAAQVAGLVVWGLHRDTTEFAAIGLPGFSYGSYPAGPVRLDEREPVALVTAADPPYTFRRHLRRTGEVIEE